LRPVEANILVTLISKVIRTKWTRGIAHAVVHLLCKCEALSSKPSPTKTKQTPITKTPKPLTSSF
jgi:hypothetical protein